MKAQLSIISAAAAALLTACMTPTYTVRQSDTRFSDVVVSSAEGNRISRKSIAGGVHIDNTGVQINPMIARKAGQVHGLYLRVVNATSRDSQFGAPNTFGTLTEMTFLIDGERLQLALRGDREYGDVITSNSVTHAASIGILETGMVSISPQDFSRIVRATTLVVRIQGTQREMTYENKDILPDFRTNLRTFYEQQVARTP